MCPACGNPRQGHERVSISFGSSRISGAERHLSARWYGLEALLVCTSHQPPELVLRRSSVPHKRFSWLQTAHHRWNGCRIISSRPWVGLREGEGVFNTPSFLSVSRCLDRGTRMGDCWGQALSVSGFRDLRRESCWVALIALIPNQATRQDANWSFGVAHNT